MRRYQITYYTNTSPIISLEYKAFTFRQAKRKAFRKVKYVNSLQLGTVQYISIDWKGWVHYF